MLYICITMRSEYLEYLMFKKKKQMKLLDNDFFIKNTNVKVDYKNKLSIKVNPEGFSTFERLYLKTKDGTIITLPPFLQRYLQEQIWKHNNYGKSKSYISSSIVATSMFKNKKPKVPNMHK
jgi:hypothetical protein